MATQFDIAGGKFSIRPAADADAKAVRMLVPELRDVAAAFVAVDHAHGLVIGAAAATRLARRQPLVGPGVAVHVIEPCRGQGIGTALVRQLGTAARRAGAAALYTARRALEGSDEMRGWMTLGFVPCETVREHMLPLDQFEPQLAPLLDRMRERGRIPPAARITPLYQANLPAVLQLHLDHLGGNRGELYRKLRGDGAGAFHPRYSRVLVVGDKTLGCILAHRYDEETAVVDADIVDPSLARRLGQRLAETGGHARSNATGNQAISIYVLRSLQRHAQLFREAGWRSHANHCTHDAAASA